jgi:hypothetical protein
LFVNETAYSQSTAIAVRFSKMLKFMQCLFIGGNKTMPLDEMLLTKVRNNDTTLNSRYCRGNQIGDAQLKEINTLIQRN